LTKKLAAVTDKNTKLFFLKFSKTKTQTKPQYENEIEYFKQIEIEEHTQIVAFSQTRLTKT